MTHDICHMTHEEDYYFLYFFVTVAVFHTLQEIQCLISEGQFFITTKGDPPMLSQNNWGSKAIVQGLILTLLGKKTQGFCTNRSRSCKTLLHHGPLLQELVTGCQISHYCRLASLVNVESFLEHFIYSGEMVKKKYMLSGLR